jgi:hypothetical protein
LGVTVSFLFLVIGMLIAISLSACSSGEARSNSISAEAPIQAQPETSVGASSGDAIELEDQGQDSEETSPESQESLIDSFREVTYASCEKALAEGVVEKSAEQEGLVLVMIPKREAIAGYSAAYFLSPDTFPSCALANHFSLSEEAGKR